MNVERIKLNTAKKTAAKPANKLRVCGYARVSTETDEQKTSFEGQVKHYTKLIRANPEWEYAGVYADYGITGTSADKRPEFQRMIKDCEEGRIDLVLTKSISRFARNTLECLTYVRRLNDIGVHIIFESNNIDTRAAFSEMLLTVLAAFAQEESRSISENTIWGIRKRFEEGITRWCKLYGYTKNENGEYQIVPEQAVVVQKIFWMYEHGENTDAIREYLAEKGIESPNGKPSWARSTVQHLLSNERYAGDILLQKFCVENHISHKAIRNDNTEVPSYYIENHHTAIISRKQFDRCQKIMAMHQNRGTTGGKDSGKCNQYPLADKLRCPHCGSPLYQRTISVQVGHTAGWCCEVGEDACKQFIIRSALVEEALLEAYRLLDGEKVAAKVRSPRFGKAAELTLAVKKENPEMTSVEFWWVDDLIDHIEFGAHSRTELEVRRAAALGEQVTDDRTMKVFWKCGLITMVKSGVTADINNPATVAQMHWKWVERQKAREEGEPA